jgi:hypothetical protein
MSTACADAGSLSESGRVHGSNAMGDIRQLPPWRPAQRLLDERPKQATLQGGNQVQIRPADERTESHFPSSYRWPEQKPGDRGERNNQPQENAANKQLKESNHEGHARSEWTYHQPSLTLPCPSTNNASTSHAIPQFTSALPGWLMCAFGYAIETAFGVGTKHGATRTRPRQLSTDRSCPRHAPTSAQRTSPVVAHQEQLVPSGVRRVHGNLGRRKGVDQPVVSGVDDPEFEDVAEERSVGVASALYRTTYAA